MIRTTACSIALTLTLTVPSLTFPQSVALDAKRFSAELAEMKERLGLTDAQMTEVRPIMQESAERRLVILSERGLNGPEDVAQLSLFRRVSLARDMKKVRDETDERLGRVLTQVQMSEFRNMRDEFQQQRSRLM